MLNRKLYLVVILTFFVFIASKTQGIQESEVDFSRLTGPYLGQKPPGMKPEVFAPDILPASNYHTSPVFTPDGKEVFWKMQGTKTITMMKIENGFWTTPKEITLSSNLNDFRDPCISPDNKKLFFLSKGVLPNQSQEKENIWFVERLKDGWSEPKPLDEDINSHRLHWQVSVASNGNLYFTSRMTGIEDIYFSKYLDGKYQKPESLGIAINTEKMCETTPFISPDENYIIFSRWDLADKNSFMQPYISFRNKDGTWDSAIKMDNIGYCLCPQVSPDGKYFFFLGIVNGEFRVMWVSAKVIKDLKQKEFK